MSSSPIEFEVKAFPMDTHHQNLDWVLKLRFPKLIEHDCCSRFVQLHFVFQ